MPDRLRPSTGRPAAENHRFEIAQELRGRQIFSHLGPGDEAHALLGHQAHAPLDQLLVELHVGNAVDQKSADAIGALEDRDLVSGAIELRGGSQPGRARAHHRHALSRAHRRLHRLHPAFGESAVGDGLFQHLDVHRRQVDGHRATSFAGRGADSAGELGEIVGLAQPDPGFFPLPAIDEVVPLGNQVVDRASRGHSAEQLSRVAEGDAAVHAARSLLAQRLLGMGEVHLVPVLDAQEQRPIVHRRAIEFHEARRLAH